MTLVATEEDFGAVVAGSVAAGAGWFRAAATANVAAALSLVAVFGAIASLLSGNIGHLSRNAKLSWLVIGTAALGAQTALSALGGWMSGRGADSVEHELRRRLLALLFAPGAPPTNSPVASRLLMEEAEKVGDASSRWEPIRVQAAVIPAVVVAFVLATNWLVGVLLLAAAPFIPLNMAIFGMGAERLSQQQASQVATLDSLVLDRIKGAESLRSLGAATRERSRVAAAADLLATRSLSVLRVALLSSAALEALVTYAVAMSATYIGLVLLGYVHISWAPTSLGLRSGIFLLLLAPAFFQPFRDLAGAYHDHRDLQTATATLWQELGAPLGAPVRPNNNRHLRPTGPLDLAVYAKGVGLRYPGAETDTLREVDWAVPFGAVAGVAGPSGSGKTTLLRLAGGRLVPSTGSIEGAGHDMAWVSQRPYFFQDSIAENLRVGRAGATEGDLWETLRVVGMADVVAAVPGRLSAKMGWDGAGLSGGQARRLALGRALLSGAGTLLLDEPTAHLDPVSEADLLSAIVALAPRHTIIIASHSEAVLDQCSQVLRLAKRRL